MRDSSAIQREQQQHFAGAAAGTAATHEHARHHVWHSDDAAHQRNAVASSAPLQAPLPGIAALFPHHDSRHSSSSHGHHSRHHSHHQQQHHHDTNVHNSSTEHRHHAAVPSFNQLLSASQTAYAHASDVKRHYARADEASRGSSPGLDAFKRIGIASSSSASMTPPLRLNAAVSPQPRHPLHPGTSGADAAARTHTSYKLKADSSSAAVHHHHRPVRTSRYLREVDRRNILRRIESGEKQADLAKEYQVSRAAISNLKQRRSRKGNNVASNQHSEEEASSGASAVGERTRSGYARDSQQQQQAGQHHYYSDSERMSSTSASPASSPLTSVAPSPHAPSLEPLEERSLSAAAKAHVVELDATMREALFARLIDQDTDMRVLQASVLRLARLLLEQALGLLSTRTLTIPVPAPRGTAPSASPSRAYTSVTTAQPVCAVAVTERAAALLHEFQVMEPQREIGYVSFASSLPPTSPASAMKTEDDGIAMQLPRHVHESSVFVLDPLCSHRSIHELIIAVQVRVCVYDLDRRRGHFGPHSHSRCLHRCGFLLQALLSAGVAQDNVYVVTLCSHESALAHLFEQFPRVHVVTAKLLPVAQDSSSNDVLEWLYSRLVR